MGTTIRPELSLKNRYWISKHRYYELKHFCMQYHEWKSKYTSIDRIMRSSSIVLANDKSENASPNPSITEKYAEVLISLKERIDIVEQSCKEASQEYCNALIAAVTTGVGYEKLKARYNIYLPKDCWYVLYRKVFWIIDKKRD